MRNRLTVYCLVACKTRGGFNADSLFKERVTLLDTSDQGHSQ